MTPEQRTEQDALELAEPLELAKRMLADSQDEDWRWSDESIHAVASALLSLAAERDELRAENERAEKLKPAPNHIHTNPSPSHEVDAWCNGAGYDAPEYLRGCGQKVALSSFKDGPHESYLQDIRYGWVPAQTLKDTEADLEDSKRSRRTLASRYSDLESAARELTNTAALLLKHEFPNAHTGLPINSYAPRLSAAVRSINPILDSLPSHPQGTDADPIQVSQQDRTET